MESGIGEKQSIKYLQFTKFSKVSNQIRNSSLLTFESWLSERHNYPHLFIIHPAVLR